MTKEQRDEKLDEALPEGKTMEIIPRTTYDLIIFDEPTKAKNPVVRKKK